jgi:multidrug efflux system membrane fusion protein
VATAAQTKAKLQQAKINLSYTRIVSPIDGLTGSVTVKSGNVVSPADSAPLVTINQMKPILVQYNLAQQFLPEIRKYNAQHDVKVFITNEDGTGARGEGKLVFIDNTVNTATGTVMFKAEVANKNIQLWPGEYVGVNTRLAVQADAVTIPDSAVQSGQDGNFVYEVVDGVAKVQKVTVDRVVGSLAVIRSGLDGGELVVTQVPRSLRSGLAVTTNAPADAAPATPATPTTPTTP